ncbi:MAG TPA: hypothetical protein VEJ84_10320 [Acidimicrobiales bacterium]|nr:hypothetical protein [Acidimicrobiales bacterium]
MAAAMVAGIVALERLQAHGQRVIIQPPSSPGSPTPGPSGRAHKTGSATTRKLARTGRPRGQRGAAAASRCGPGSVVVAESGAYLGGSGPGSVTCYSPASTGDAVPTQSVFHVMGDPDALAFDSSGDLWVGNITSNELVEYPRAQLSNANPVPGVVISADAGRDSPNSPATLTFDGSGDLWVADQGDDTVTEYSRAQLAKSGSPTPYKTIRYSGLDGPGAVRFDHSGDLWVSNISNVVEFTKAELAKANPVPSVVISSTALVSGTGTGVDMAFDQQGDLWAANFGGVFVELTKAQLARSGAPSPHVTIGTYSLLELSGLALDPSGDVWLSETSNNVVEFTKAQLAKSGTPAPARVIAGPKTGMNAPGDIAIVP